MNITVKQLSPDLMDDYFSFFDHTAFCDNPDWSFCYCYFNQFPHDDKIWKNQKSTDNRNEVCNLIQNGRLNGYLAYFNGNVIGWCNTGPRIEMTTLPEYPEPDEHIIGFIVCFIVEKKYRRKGVAKTLLQEACVGFKKLGFQIVEAYPLKDANGEKENHFGPLSLYLTNGFDHYKDDEDTFVVRKYL